MRYVYILQSEEHPCRHYAGITGDLRRRLKKHNAGEVSHTSKYAPWTIKTYIAFADEKQAFAFEKYLKSLSGRALPRSVFEASSARGPMRHLLFWPSSRWRASDGPGRAHCTLAAARVGYDVISIPRRLAKAMT